MKKVLICMLLVLLTLCLFVSCSNEPKSTPTPTPTPTNGFRITFYKVDENTYKTNPLSYEMKESEIVGYIITTAEKMGGINDENTKFYLNDGWTYDRTNVQLNNNSNKYNICYPMTSTDIQYINTNTDITYNANYALMLSTN